MTLFLIPLVGFVFSLPELRIRVSGNGVARDKAVANFRCHFALHVLGPGTIYGLIGGAGLVFMLCFPRQSTVAFLPHVPASNRVTSSKGIGASVLPSWRIGPQSQSALVSPVLPQASGTPAHHVAYSPVMTQTLHT